MSWQDPYGQGPQDMPGWQDPYAQPGYGSPYGPPGGVMPPASTGPAIAALVCNIVAALLCCIGIGWLPGIIFSAMALSRASRDPLSSRKLMMWSWICLAISVVVAVALIVVLVLIGHYQSSDSTT